MSTKRTANPIPATDYSAHGKLLLTGEYLVLDGALALAVPTRQGQRMSVSTIDSPTLHWESYTQHGEQWLQAAFSLPELRLLHTNDQKIALTLQKLLAAVAEQSPAVWTRTPGATVRTYLEFSQDWGLGSSSTLISLISQWTGTDPYRLLAATFGGSGYDIACATASQAILFQHHTDEAPRVQRVNFQPPFGKQLYFIHLNQKQNSREGIARYRQRKAQQPDSVAAAVAACTLLTQKTLTASTLTQLEACLAQHEQLVSEVIGLPPVQHTLFADYSFGIIKSLGAWGGDFVLATSAADPVATQHYFSRKGYATCVPYDEMVLPLSDHAA